MTLINILLNKFLTLIGQGELAAVKSSTHIMFGMFAIIMVVCGLMTIANRCPVLSKYKGYTKESIAEASTLLGISDIVLGVLDIVIGVLPMTAALSLPICIAAGAVLAAFIAVYTMATKKLVKIAA